jgi:DNA-binding MarR family transcriptional regulator
LTASRRRARPARPPDIQTAESATAHGLSLGILPELLGFHVRLAHVAMYRDFAEHLAALDLTQKQAATLQLIGANEGLSQIDICATLGTDRSTIMGLVSRLQKRALVTRQRSKVDGRRQELYLTPKGKATLAQANALVRKHERNFTERFTAPELAALFDALKRVHRRT